MDSLKTQGEKTHVSLHLLELHISPQRQAALHSYITANEHPIPLSLSLLNHSQGTALSCINMAESFPSSYQTHISSPFWHSPIKKGTALWLILASYHNCTNSFMEYNTIDGTGLLLYMSVFWTILPQLALQIGELYFFKNIIPCHCNCTAWTSTLR